MLLHVFAVWITPHRPWATYPLPSQDSAGRGRDWALQFSFSSSDKIDCVEVVCTAEDFTAQLSPTVANGACQKQREM